jgi:hypothetical protein
MTTESSSACAITLTCSKKGRQPISGFDEMRPMMDALAISRKKVDGRQGGWPC